MLSPGYRTTYVRERVGRDCGFNRKKYSHASLPQVLFHFALGDTVTQYNTFHATRVLQTPNSYKKVPQICLQIRLK